MRPTGMSAKDTVDKLYSEARLRTLAKISEYVAVNAQSDNVWYAIGPKLVDLRLDSDWTK